MQAAAQHDSFVPRYRPLLELGRGGMARVYLAESMASGLRKLVVLKVLNQELASDPEMRDAFIREAEISARLNHPGIVNVYEVFEQGSTAVMVMQHLDGMALSEITSRLSGKVPLKLHLHVLCQLLDALHYFHELKTASGVSLDCVHRDVSPHNVMVLHEGGVKVVDFGIAKVRSQSENHTRTGVIKGKVSYMPPEQLLSCATVDRRADIYSVGVMLWEAVACRRMWRGMDSMARMRAIVRGEIPSIREAAPGVSDALAKIIERALAPTPEGRFATAEEMQIELEQVAHTEGGYSLPRELAAFMRENFGDERRERQRAIEKAIEEPEVSGLQTSWSTAASASGVAERAALHDAPAMLVAPENDVALSPEHPRRRALRALVVGGACIIALGLALWSPKAPPENGGEARGSVNVPPIESSGAPATQAPPPKPAAKLKTQEAKSAQPRSAEHDAAVALGADEQDARTVSARPRRQPARAPNPPRAKPNDEAASAPALPAATKPEPPADCDPPYRLDPGGVKVFKPQCF